MFEDIPFSQLYSMLVQSFTTTLQLFAKLGNWFCWIRRNQTSQGKPKKKVKCCTYIRLLIKETLHVSNMATSSMNLVFVFSGLKQWKLFNIFVNGSLGCKKQRETQGISHAYRFTEMWSHSSSFTHDPKQFSFLVDK